MSSTIPAGLRGDVMRKRIEDKNTLQNKGSLYVGTGENETITYGGDDHVIWATNELQKGSDGTVLKADNSTENGLVYSTLGTGSFTDSSITGAKLDINSCVDETLSGSYIEKAGLKKDLVNNQINLDLKESNWYTTLNQAGDAITSFACDSITWDNKNTQGTGYDFTYGNGSYVLLNSDNNWTSDLYIITAQAVNVSTETSNLFWNKSGSGRTTITQSHTTGTYTYNATVSWSPTFISNNSFGTESVTPYMHRTSYYGSSLQDLQLPAFNFLAVGDTAQNVSVTVSYSTTGVTIPLDADGFYHVPVGTLLRFDVTFPTNSTPEHTPVSYGYFGPSNTFMPQMTLSEKWTNNGTWTSWSSSATDYGSSGSRPSGFPASAPTGKRHYLMASVTTPYTFTSNEARNVRIGWGFYDTTIHKYIIGDANLCEWISYSINLTGNSLTIYGATNTDKPTSGHGIVYLAAASAEVMYNNIWAGHWMNFTYEAPVNKVGYYYIQYAASSNNAGGWVVIPLKAI